MVGLSGTPDHCVSTGRSEVALLLQKYNADRTISCNEGLKPYELAHRWGHTECREICKFIVPLVTALSVSTYC